MGGGSSTMHHVVASGGFHFCSLIGLVDGYGTVETVARDIFKAPDILDYTMKENFAERVAKRFGAEVGAAAGKALIKTPDLK